MIHFKPNDVQDIEEKKETMRLKLESLEPSSLVKDYLQYKMFEPERRDVLKRLLCCDETT